MSKKRKKDRVKLPKQFLGVKIPKSTRKNLNALLKNVPASTVKPVAGAAVAALVTALAARIEQPLHDFVEGQDGGKKKKERRDADIAAATAH